MPQKICYIISDVDMSHWLEAMCRNVAKAGYDVSVIFIAETEPQLYKKLEAEGLLVKFIKSRGKSGLLNATKRTFEILGEIKPDIVHTHLFRGSFAGLLAARMRGIKKIKHRDHGSECHLYYPHGVYYDRFLNKMSDHIVAISQNVAEILINKEFAVPEKISVVNYGFELGKIKSEPSTVEKLKETYGLENNYPVVAAISRFIHLKGLQYLIPAFGKLTRKYPNAKLVLANARGPYKPEVQSLLDEHLPEKNYVLIEFETEIYSLYKTFDLFVHIPVSDDAEAFGQTYIEPLLLDVPSVFTLSGIARDFIVDGENALVVDFCDSEAVYKAMDTILQDTELRKRIIKRGKKDALGLFHISRAVKELDELYSRL